jgi:hypothetical protein
MKLIQTGCEGRGINSFDFAYRWEINWDEYGNEIRVASDLLNDKLPKNIPELRLVVSLIARGQERW